MSIMAMGSHEGAGDWIKHVGVLYLMICRKKSQNLQHKGVVQFVKLVACNGWLVEISQESQDLFVEAQRHTFMQDYQRRGKYL